MYTREQVTELQSKLDDLRVTKNRLEALQSITWLAVDFGYKDTSCHNLPIESSTAEKIHELLLAEYTSRVKVLQDEIENTIIVNPSKL